MVCAEDEIDAIKKIDQESRKNDKISAVQYIVLKDSGNEQCRGKTAIVVEIQTTSECLTFTYIIPFLDVSFISENVGCSDRWAAHKIFIYQPIWRPFRTKLVGVYLPL